MRQLEEKAVVYLHGRPDCVGPWAAQIEGGDSAYEAYAKNREEAIMLLCEMVFADLLSERKHTCTPKT